MIQTFHTKFIKTIQYFILMMLLLIIRQLKALAVNVHMTQQISCNIYCQPLLPHIILYSIICIIADFLHNLIMDFNVSIEIHPLEARGGSWQAIFGSYCEHPTA